MDEPVALEQMPPIRLYRVSIGADDRAARRFDWTPAIDVDLQMSASIGTINGGSLMIRGSPSWTA